MGDRAEIIVNGVHMYTHWGASTLENTLRAALKRGLRWDDEEYLARIIFCEMVKDEIDGETGYGLSIDTGDTQFSLIVKDGKVTKEDKTTVSFEDFIKEEDSQ